MKRVSAFVLCAVVSGLFQITTAPDAFADSILGNDLAGFAVLGASTVTNTGSTTLVNGSVGVDAGSAIVAGSTGFVFAGGSAGTTIVNGIANAAQTELDIAIALIGGLTPTYTISGGLLDGLILGQGVYSVSAAPGNGGFNLSTGATLKLDAQGLANPFWAFQMSSTLITGSSSMIQFINAPVSGFNPGVYWGVGSSATLGTYSTFQGNILAQASVGLNTGATIGCGSALAATGAVTMDTNVISTGCDVSLQTDGGGQFVLDLNGTPVPTPTPEPGTLLLLGTGIAGLVARRGRGRQAAPKA